MGRWADGIAKILFQTATMAIGRPLKAENYYGYRSQNLEASL